MLVQRLHIRILMRVANTWTKEYEYHTEIHRSVTNETRVTSLSANGTICGTIFKISLLSFFLWFEDLVEQGPFNMPETMCFPLT